jgi:acyl-CoA reductase-like NAD-dependent aldehyde dehydrogenase
MGDVREALAAAVYDGIGSVDPEEQATVLDALETVVEEAVAKAVKRHVVQLVKEKHAARAQALRDAAEHLPEVRDVLRGMAAREVGGR